MPRAGTRIHQEGPHASRSIHPCPPPRPSPSQQPLPVSQAYRAIDQHVCRRLRHWLCVKHQVRGHGTARFPDARLYQELGLVRLSARTRSFSWAKA